MADLLKLAIYIRQMMTGPELRDYLAGHHPEDLAFFESVLAESECKAAGRCHTFGTHLSKNGVPRYSAQAAMLHSSLHLTMSVYTDPSLLDVARAHSSATLVRIAN